VCLTLTITAPGAPPERLQAAETTDAPLDVVFWNGRRLLGRGSPSLGLSPKGGCACEVLTDEADWDAPTWDMLPAARSDLATTLAQLAAVLPRPFSFQAIWISDTVDRDHSVSLDELLGLASEGRLGTRDRYTVG
jgi:hypothetical protein